MSSTKTQPARGMRDFLPADVRKREYVIGVIKEVYERYGFEPLETPAVENIETLMGKYGEEGNQLIFKILKRGEHEKTGEADLALRYDLTVPLARVVAQYQNELPKFFKRYQIQPVWRADRPARGRFREFYQCDVDVLGSKSMVVEAELIAAASDALKKLGFSDFTIRLNHRQVLTGILRSIGIPEEKHNDAMIAFDKLDKIGREGVRKELNLRGIVTPEDMAKALDSLFPDKISALFVGQKADDLDFEAYNADLLGRTRERFVDDEAGRTAVDDLSKILELIGSTSAAKQVEVDTTLARGLSYYTGAIIEINIEGIGSLGGGGRYDNLVGMFLGKDVPACGFSLGLERIIVVMSERNMFPTALISSPADVMVTIWNEDSAGESIALATELRSKGLRVDLYPEADKMGKQFKYASSRGIPFVAIIGDDERARGEVAIKNMESGEQRSVKRAGLTSELESLGLRVRTAKLRRNEIG
jgi:histidyl-tRNA synthetase